MIAKLEGGEITGRKLRPNTVANAARQGRRHPARAAHARRDGDAHGDKAGRQTSLVFGEDDGQPFHRNSWVRALERTATRVELAKHVHPHMTRLNWASHCVAQELPTRASSCAGAGGRPRRCSAATAHRASESVDHSIDPIAPSPPLRVLRGGSKTGSTEGPGSKTAP